MERKLATIRVINDIRPIEGADMIELATVGGWNIVVAKNVGLIHSSQLKKSLSS